MVSVPARRQQVAYGRGRGLSARRACTLFSVARSALEYRSRKAAKDAPVVTRMKELSAQYPRYGYRRIRIFPRPRRPSHEPRPGAPAVANGKAAGAAQAAEEAHSRCAAATPASAGGPNQVWSLRLRVRPLRQWSAAQVPDRRPTSSPRKAWRSMSTAASARRPRHRGVVAPGERARRPSFLRSDNGPEFVSKALLSWIVAQGIGTALIEPGKPWQNGVAESFNGKFRDECLSLEWFRSRAEAKVI